MMLRGGGGASDKAFWAWADSVIAAAGVSEAAAGAGAAGETDLMYGVLLVAALTVFMEIPFAENE